MQRLAAYSASLYDWADLTADELNVGDARDSIMRGANCSFRDGQRDAQGQSH